MNNKYLLTGYPQGNAEAWMFAVQSYLPRAFTTMFKTVDPVIYATLIKLVGSDSKFGKERCDVGFTYSKDNIPTYVTFNLSYIVPTMKVSSADQEDVEHDRQFIYTNIKRLPQMGNLPTNAVQIDTKTGRISIKITLALGVPQ